MPLHILHLTTSFPSNPGNISGPFVHKLALAEIRRGLVCTVLTPSNTRPATWPNNYNVRRFRYAPWSCQRLAQQPGGIPVALEKQTWLYSLLPAFLASMGLSLIQLARQHDIIHAHWSACGAMAVLTQSMHRRPVITTLRGSDVYKAKKSGPFSLLHRKSIQGSSFTVGVSQAMAAELSRQHPGMADKIRFVSDGVDEDFYALPANRHRLSLSPFKLLFVGSLIPRKGLDVLLKALAGINSQASWTLTVAGDGPERGYLRSLATDLGIAPGIRFLGNIPPARIPKLMRDHYLFILPSYWEGRPSVVHEAMAAAMPVLATDIDGTRELVTDGQTGWLVPLGDVNALSSVLDDLIGGKKNLEAAGLAGRQWMLEQGLTWDETARRYHELYYKAMTVPSF
ncbi:MAG: glycosyltransferase [Bacteroidales bacterium]|nr:glycosyltransferase [Bacteroidales bacterium]